MMSNIEIAEASDRLRDQLVRTTEATLDVPPPAVDAPARVDETGVELKRGAFLNTIAKVRRQHRDRVQEGAAFELYSGFVYARWCIRCRRRDVERTLYGAHWLLTEQVIGLGDFSVIRHTS